MNGSGKTLRALRTGLAALVVMLSVLILGAAAAYAQPLVAVELDDQRERVEITTNGRVTESASGVLQVETAASAEGVTGRMAVRATAQGQGTSWFVFALKNTTDRAIERWVTTDRYELLGSGVIWPDLDAGRIEVITPSIGFLPERVRSDRADVFRVSLEPGQTVTYAAELAASRTGRIQVWKPLEYQLKARDRQLFNGIMLGITGLLGVFLTAVFAANHKPIFPSAALVAWCVLGYLCVDFGFWHKLLQLRVDDNSVWRAATEAAIAASLVIFLHTFLRIGAWHGFLRMLSVVWIVAQLALVFLAVFDPRLASTFARLAFALIGVVGALVMLFLAVRGQDRALSLIPTWMLFLVWVMAAAFAAAGRLQGDLVVSGLVAGLVLVVVLIGFTVTQFAFGANEPMAVGGAGNGDLVGLAVDGSGAALFDWSARRDEIKISSSVEAALGLVSGELAAKTDDVLRHVHPADRERLRVLLWSVKERSGGSFRTEFRLRHSNNSYRWFDLSAGTSPVSDARSLRCVGLLRDITDQKRAHERLLNDAVRDSLTGLPHRQLLLDRLGVALVRAREEPGVRPTVLLVDIDKFKSVNASFGVVVGDSLLLTIARRLERLIGEHDTLARIGGDQFAALLPYECEPQKLAQVAEEMRRAIKSPIKIAGQDLILTGVIGIAVYDGEQREAGDLLNEAEVAMYRAKRQGADHIEIFTPELRGAKDDRVAIENDLRVAIERGQLSVLYQPIIYLATEELAGFEALVRWEHPRHGLLNPSEFVGIAEESDLIVRLGAHVLDRAVAEAERWQRELPRTENALFVSVNVSARQLVRPEIVQDVRQVVGKSKLAPGSIRLEITESLVMQNPEQASELLEALRATGVRLSLDDFGTGYSSLAYLQRFPFDTIKIDRSLVHVSEGMAGGRAIVRSVVALAHELGKRVVAEGVETPEEVAFLRGLACEYAQGFYYGEPMTSSQVRQMLKEVRKSERRAQRRGLFRTTKPQQPAADEPPKARKPRPAAQQTAGEATDGPPTETARLALAPPPPPPAYVQPVVLQPMPLPVPPLSDTAPPTSSSPPKAQPVTSPPPQPRPPVEAAAANGSGGQGGAGGSYGSQAARFQGAPMPAPQRETTTGQVDASWAVAPSALSSALAAAATAAAQIAPAEAVGEIAAAIGQQMPPHVPQAAPPGPPPIQRPNSGPSQRPADPPPAPQPAQPLPQQTAAPSSPQRPRPAEQTHSVPATVAAQPADEGSTPFSFPAPPDVVDMPWQNRTIGVPPTPEPQPAASAMQSAPPVAIAAPTDTTEPPPVPVRAQPVQANVVSEPQAASWQADTPADVVPPTQPSTVSGRQRRLPPALARSLAKLAGDPAVDPGPQDGARPGKTAAE